MLASAPLLAASVNAPFLFGRSLWQETRIPLFEQSIALFDRTGRDGRVSFGNGYVQSSLFELFVQNRDVYPVLLPILFDDSPSALRHMRLHNGTIWRWNRPLAGFEDDSTPHLRIEHRTMPAGPTIVDMIANAAAYFGVVLDIADNPDLGADSLPFERAMHSFYEAARHGLDARIDWPRIGRVPARSLLLDHVLPAARRGLQAFCVSEADIDFFLGVLEARVANGQTGAKWQIEALERYGGNFHEMMSVYCERQRSGAPVHQWDL